MNWKQISKNEIPEHGSWIVFKYESYYSTLNVTSYILDCLTGGEYDGLLSHIEWWFEIC